MSTEEFICPECGSREEGQTVNVSAVPDEAEPWTSVLKWIQCGLCRSVIPAHLGERWENLPLEQAQKEWREIYRESQPRFR